jgi:hypothetical protein
MEGRRTHGVLGDAQFDVTLQCKDELQHEVEEE